MSDPQLADEGLYAKYMLHDPDDIRGCLQDLAAAGCALLVHAAGTDTAETTVLAVGVQSLWVAVPVDAALAAQLVAADRLRFEASVNRVTVRFATGAAKEGSHAGASALEVPLPVKLMHLQRREHVRHAAPGTLGCLLSVVTVDGGRRTTRAAIADIGGGGLAVLTTDDPTLTLSEGDVFEGVLLELPGQDPMTVTLRVQHANRVDRAGRSVWRAGCSFVDLTVSDQARLLRYVMQLDRDEPARIDDR